MADRELENIVSSVNPANLKSFAGTIKEILRFHDIKQETVVPAQVVSYDRTTHLAKVQALVQNAYTTQKGVEYKSGDLMELPVLRLQHGMYWMDAPLYPGDTGYVVAGHRDGSLAVEGNNRPVLPPKDGQAQTNNMGPQPPNTYLLHRFESGFFVPCRWGTVEVDEEDKDSLVVARFKEKTKEIERDGEKSEVFDGVDGKVALDKDGTVRIVNGTGLVIRSDEYRQAEEDEQESADDKVDENGQRMKRKPSVYIDPTSGLDKTDARFRVVEMPTGGGYVGEDGNVHIPTKSLRVLADEGTGRGNEYIVPVKGVVEAYDKGGSWVKNIFMTAKSYIDDVPVKVEKKFEDGYVTFDLTLGVEKEEREDDPNYCNNISNERSSDTDSDDTESHEEVGFGVNKEIVDNEISDDTSILNDISYTPCVS